jgi:hypothetical protein
MKGMAKRTLKVHLPKIMDLQSRVKRLAGNGNRLSLLLLLWRGNNLVKQRIIKVILAKCNLQKKKMVN